MHALLCAKRINGDIFYVRRYLLQLADGTMIIFYADRDPKCDMPDATATCVNSKSLTRCEILSAVCILRFICIGRSIRVMVSFSIAMDIRNHREYKC